MLYLALIYLIIVALYAIFINNPEVEQEIVDRMEENNPDCFSVIDARAFYRKFVVLIIIFSPFLVIIGILQAIYGAIFSDTGNV